MIELLKVGLSNKWSIQTDTTQLYEKSLIN